MKGYESYKESGVEWIGEIPNDWSITKLKFISNIFNGNSLNEDLKEKYESVDLNNISYISTKDVEQDTGNINLENGIRIPRGEGNFKLAPKGSFVLCIEGANAGKKIGYLNEDVYFVNKLACFDYDNKFLYYYALSDNFKNQFFNSLSGLIGGVSISIIRNFHSTFPPIEEQTKIAAFLDYKTNLIDATIEKKKRLIELLKEKRQAVINEAVTKGLNPNAPMKDSGVEWLGEIPEHWKIKKLKYSVDFISEKASNINRGIALEDITSWTGQGKLRDTSHFEGDLILFEKGDVLFSKLRPYLAKVYMANEKGGAVGELMVLRPKLNIINQAFLYNRLISKGFIDVVDGSTYGAKMPRASISFILDLKFGVPPLIEQLEINDYINKIIVTSNKLSEKLDIAIEKLQTYRQSLISEAVTGKIDVRDWQPPKNN